MSFPLALQQHKELRGFPPPDRNQLQRYEERLLLGTAALVNNPCPSKLFIPKENNAPYLTFFWLVFMATSHPLFPLHRCSSVGAPENNSGTRQGSCGSLGSSKLRGGGKRFSPLPIFLRFVLKAELLLAFINQHFSVLPCWPTLENVYLGIYVASSVWNVPTRICTYLCSHTLCAGLCANNPTVSPTRFPSNCSPRCCFPAISKF